MKCHAAKKDPQQQPPFSLYRNASNPSFNEGLASVVKLLKTSKKIVVLTGAGISVSCGIPDFRSKQTGLYKTLDAEELGLSCAEELFDFEVFQENPKPFFSFARNLYFPLGKDQRAQPSDSHKLLALLEEKKMLLRVYSQNIDGLEQKAGVSTKKVVYAHGSLQWATCCKCKRKVSSEQIEDDILNGTVARCQAPVVTTNNARNSNNSNKPNAQAPSRKPSERTTRKRPLTNDNNNNDNGSNNDSGDQQGVCGGVMKPGVTFFGETLHDNVRRSLEADRDKVDALIVIGTSLSVAPISKVIGYLPASIPRILINRTVVHPSRPMEDEDDEDDDEEEDKEFRTDYVFDAYLLGFCDDVTRILAKKLFSDVDDLDVKEDDGGKLLACLKEDDEHYDKEDWSCSNIPAERVFLFPGAQAPTTDNDDETEHTYREIAHCNGCSNRIEGTIQKCVTCFDFDLCQKCFPAISKTHYEGQHHFAAETACPVLEAMD